MKIIALRWKRLRDTGSDFIHVPVDDDVAAKRLASLKKADTHDLFAISMSPADTYEDVLTYIKAENT
jgi:hypothetical protein